MKYLDKLVKESVDPNTLVVVSAIAGRKIYKRLGDIHPKTTEKKK
ncbi:hypothetical protein [Aeromonas veronii]